LLLTLALLVLFLKKINYSVEKNSTHMKRSLDFISS
jgi:hypothetical protein